MRPQLKVVLCLLLIGGFLRFYRLDHYPLPMHQDELSDAYDAYSLAETGADRTGAQHPIVLRALGAADYRPAMYAWLASIPMRIGGFSVVAARLPSAALGVLSLLLLFFFARRLVDENFAIVALALATFSPWHITYSRLAHQGAMLPAFFAILALWLWQNTAFEGYRSLHLLVLGTLVGLSANAYQTTRLVAPLLVVMIAIDCMRFCPHRRRVWLLLAGAIIGASPQIVVMLTEPGHFFARLASTTVAAMPPGESGLELFAHGLSLLFGPRLLFWPNMEDSGYLAARLLLFALPFYYMGFAVLYRLQPMTARRFRFYVYAVFVISLLPALFTAGTSSIRVTSALLLVPLFTSAGIIWTVRGLKSWGLPSAVSSSTIAAAALLSIGLTGYMYFWSKTVNGVRSNNVLVQIGEHLRPIREKYGEIFVADSPQYSALHVAAFSGIHPLEFQRTRRAVPNEYGWDYIKSVDNLRFGSPREIPKVVREMCASPGRSLIVSRQKISGAEAFDSVSWHVEKYYFTEPGQICRSAGAP